MNYKESLPLVSVIMNAYNAEEYLNESIDSALSQTYSKIEIILWDNFSTDSTASIVKEYSDPRVHYFLANHHTSLGEARNLAISQSNGEYLAFLDCDDVWMPSKLDEQLILFNDPEVGLVYSDSIFFNNNKSVSTCFANKTPYRGFCFEKLLVNYVISMETVIIRKKVINSMNHLFDVRYTAIEEYEFFARIAQKWKIDFSPLALSKWRIHSKSWTWQKKRSFIDEKMMMLKDLQSNIKSDSPYMEALKSFSNNLSFEKSKQSWAEGKSKNARLELKKINVFSRKKILLWVATFLPYNLVDRIYAFLFGAVRPDETSLSYASNSKAYTFFKNRYILYIINLCLLPISLLLLFFFKKKSFVLTYHLISKKLKPKSFNNAIATSTKLFSRQISILKILYFKFIEAKDITKKEGILITIDDGYLDTYKEVSELSDVLQIPIIHFLCPGFYMDETVRPWWYELELFINDYDFNKKNFQSLVYTHSKKMNHINILNLDNKFLLYNTIREILVALPYDIREIILSEYAASIGIKRIDYRNIFMNQIDIIKAHKTLFDYGSHTYSHIALGVEDILIAEEDIKKADKIFQDSLGYEVKSFAYPYGIESNNDKLIKMLRNRYEQIYTTRYGFIDKTTNSHSIPRISISESDGIIGFINKISGSYSILYRIYYAFKRA